MLTSTERDHLTQALCVATAIGRLSHVEIHVVIDWLEANGWLVKPTSPAPAAE
jgi:hypothetical protein